MALQACVACPCRAPCLVPQSGSRCLRNDICKLPKALKDACAGFSIGLPLDAVLGHPRQLHRRRGTTAAREQANPDTKKTRHNSAPGGLALTQVHYPTNLRASSTWLHRITQKYSSVDIRVGHSTASMEASFVLCILASRLEANAIQCC